MVTEEMNVTLDGDRFSAGGIEMRRDAVHQEVWVVPHNDERTTNLGEPRGLSVERIEIRES